MWSKRGIWGSLRFKGLGFKGPEAESFGKFKHMSAPSGQLSLSLEFGVETLTWGL